MTYIQWRRLALWGLTSPFTSNTALVACQTIQNSPQFKSILSSKEVECISCTLQGDSGFLLIRNGAVVFRSPALQHFFDCPLQFAAYPDYTNATDTSDDAGLYEIPVQAGDMIVAGTDGLWDNVPQEEILSSLPSSLNQFSQVGGVFECNEGNLGKFQSYTWTTHLTKSIVQTCRWSCAAKRRATALYSLLY